MAGASLRLRSRNARPNHDHAADRRAFPRIELRRNGRRAGVDLDPLNVLRDDVVDVEVPRFDAVDPVLWRTVAIPHLSTAEPKRRLTTATQRDEPRAGDEPHHVAQIHRIALLNLLPRKEVAEPAGTSIVEVAEHLTAASLLDGHAFDLSCRRLEHDSKSERLPLGDVRVERLRREAEPAE